MTIKQALANGYTVASNEDATYIIQLKDLTDVDLQSMNEPCFLGSKDAFKFQIPDISIREMFEKYIEEQDEVNNEDEGLYSCLDDVPWDVIAFIVNKHFDRNYYSRTDIQLETEEQFNSHNFI